MSIKSFVIGALFTSFLWGLGLVVANIQTKRPTPPDWNPRYELYTNPLLENLQVYDAEAKFSVISVTGNPPVGILDIKQLDERRWQVIVEKKF
jgi:hypothetical protein